MFYTCAYHNYCPVIAGVIYNNWEYNDPQAPSRSARPTATLPALTPTYLQTQVDLVSNMLMAHQRSDHVGSTSPTSDMIYLLQYPGAELESSLRWFLDLGVCHAMT